MAIRKKRILRFAQEDKSIRIDFKGKAGIIGDKCRAPEKRKRTS